MIIDAIASTNMPVRLADPHLGPASLYLATIDSLVLRDKSVCRTIPCQSHNSLDNWARWDEGFWCFRL